MTPGSIIYYKGFIFHDGDHADKLLIVLNDGNRRPYLVLKTTSQKHSYPDKEGCHPKRECYHIPAKRDHFHKPTWVLLYEPYELDAALFLKAKFNGDAEIVGTLKEHMLRAIINCFQKTDEWSERYRALLW